MLYKAIVEKVINTYEATVRIPLIHRTVDAVDYTPSDQLPTACISSIAGSISPVQSGDIVIVGLENDDLEKPIILGHLCKESMPQTLSSIQATSLSACVEASLPSATTIGNVSSKDISYLSNLSGNIQKQLDILSEQIKVLQNKVDS